MKQLAFSFLLIAATVGFGGTVNEFPSIAMNPDGNTVAVWQGYDNDQNTFVIRTASLPSMGSWSSQAQLSPSGKVAMYPRVAIDSSGQMIGVWEAALGTAFSIQGATGSFGSGWNIATTVSESESDDTFPEIDMDASGRGLLLWQKKSGNAYVVRTATYSMGSWGGFVSLSAPSPMMALPEAVVDSTGNAIALWQYFNGTANEIQVSSLSFGGNWTAPIVLSDPNYNSLDVQGAINDAGQGIALWQKGTASGIVVEAVIRSPEGVWGEVVPLSSETALSTNPVAAMNDSGKIVVLWQTSQTEEVSLHQPPYPVERGKPSKEAGQQTVVVQVIQAKIYSGGTWGDTATLSYRAQKGASPSIAMNSAGQAIALWTASGMVQTSILSTDNVWGSVSQLSDLSDNTFYPQSGIDTLGNGVAVWQAVTGSDTVIQSSVYTSGSSWSPKTTISD